MTTNAELVIESGTVELPNDYGDRIDLFFRTRHQLVVAAEREAFRRVFGVEPVNKVPAGG